MHKGGRAFIQSIPRLQRELQNSIEVSSDRICSAAAQEVEPLSEKTVSTAPRRLVNHKNANKNSKLVTS